MAPSGGPRDTTVSRWHREKGPHGLEAWRSGVQECTLAGAQPEGTLNPTAIYITLAIPALNPTTIYYTLEVRHRQSAVNSSRIEGEAWGVKFLLGWGAGAGATLIPPLIPKNN